MRVYLSDGYPQATARRVAGHRPVDVLNHFVNG